MPAKLRVLVVGLGHMGVTHAKAYDGLDGYELAGLCCRSIAGRNDIVKAWPDVARFADYGEALARVKPDVVSVNTWPDTHADFAVRAFQAGAHVFLEKPIAETVADARAGRRRGRGKQSQAAGRPGAAAQPHLGALHESGARARQASGYAHESEPALDWAGLDMAQGPDEIASAYRRLRRALCRYDVPHDWREACARACIARRLG